MKSKNTYKIIIMIVLPIVLLAQIENWVYTFNGPGNGWDQVSKIIYGADGNLYAAGFSQGIGTGRDFTVISLKTDGDTNWIYTYNGSGDDEDWVHSIIYGADGNIYAAGRSIGSTTDYDVIVVSLTQAGDTNWTYRYNGAGNYADLAYSIVHGADGNIYAAGFSEETYINHLDFLVISLNTDGDTNWTYTYNGPVNRSIDGAESIIYGADGNIYAAGGTHGVNINGDGLVVSLNTDGDTNWTYTYNGAGNQIDLFRQIIYGEDGNLYAAGYSTGNGSYIDLIVINLDTLGNENWVYTYNGPGDSTDLAYSITYGDDGNIYAAGRSRGSDVDFDFFVVSLKTDGDTNWTYRYDGPGNYWDDAYSIVYGADGNIYAAGYSDGSNPVDDFTVINLDTLGNENWVYTYNGPGNSYDHAYSIVYGADGNLYAAGYTTAVGSAGQNLTVISLGTTLGINDVKTDSIDIPSTVPEDTTFNPKAIVTNLGDVTETFDVTCEIDPGPYASTETIIALAPGNTVSVTFPNEFLFESGSYTVTVYTQLVTDEDPTNDTLEKIIETYNPGVTDGGSDIPTSFSFGLQSNPVRSKAVFNLALPHEAIIKLHIYDVSGRLIDNLISERKSAGFHKIPWSSEISSGVYFYKFESPWENKVGKLVLVR
jgi:uncharacterized delta-60 repeat protein